MKRESRLETESRSTTWRCDAVGPENDDVVSQKERLVERKTKEEKGLEDKKKETTEGIEEQRTLYTRTK